MGILRLSFLDRDEEEIIHAQSLECLSEIGVLIRSQSVLKMLEDAGASIDYGSSIARMPEELVKEALAKAPKEITLGARDRSRDLKLPAESHPYVSTGGVTLFVVDSETGERRDASRADLADFARLSDSIGAIDAFWPIVTTSDVPPESHMVHELWTSLQNTTKHILGSAGSGTVGVPDARTQISLGALVAGGADAFRRRPLFSVLSCVIAPLSFETGAVEAQVEYAKAGVPIISMSMSLGGLTCPVTLAGTIVNANAENLASLVITQTAAPGAPHIYSSESTLADMKTGYISYRGVETPMLMAATAQMARRYGLPKNTGMQGLDADTPGAPVPFGEAASIFLTAMSGTDLCSGIGGIDLDKGCSLEQVLIDSYLWEDFRGYLRRFVVSKEAVALDVVREVGPGNTFMNHPHTAKNFKSQIFLRDKKMELYGAMMSDRMVEDAKRTVKRILKEHQAEPLDRGVTKKGEEIIREYESGLRAI